MKPLIGRKYNRRCHKVVHPETVRRVTKGKKMDEPFLAAASSTCLRHPPFRRAVAEPFFLGGGG